MSQTNRKYIIANEGLLENTAIVTAQDENAAVVKYYETARTCGRSYGLKGFKLFTIGDITNSDGLPQMKQACIHHHADIDGEQWLEDVEPIDNWAKYGHASITSI